MYFNKRGEQLNKKSHQAIRNIKTWQINYDHSILKFSFKWNHQFYPDNDFDIENKLY